LKPNNSKNIECNTNTTLRQDLSRRNSIGSQQSSSRLSLPHQEKIIPSALHPFFQFFHFFIQFLLLSSLETRHHWSMQS